MTGPQWPPGSAPRGVPWPPGAAAGAAGDGPPVESSWRPAPATPAGRWELRRERRRILLSAVGGAVAWMMGAVLGVPLAASVVLGVMADRGRRGWDAGDTVTLLVMLGLCVLAGWMLTRGLVRFILGVIEAAQLR